MSAQAKGTSSVDSVDCIAELEQFLKLSGVEEEVKSMMKAMFEVRN